MHWCVKTLTCCCQGILRIASLAHPRIAIVARRGPNAAMVWVQWVLNHAIFSFSHGTRIISGLCTTHEG